MAKQPQNSGPLEAMSQLRCLRGYSLHLYLQSEDKDIYHIPIQVIKGSSNSDADVMWTVTLGAAENNEVLMRVELAEVLPEIGANNIVIK